MKLDKPARLSFSCSLDLLLNEISDIDQTNINRDIRDGNWLSMALSSPRAKRVGPKALRAESAMAFTCRRNSHSGRGEDFLTGQPNFFTETAITPERKVEKWFPKWEINRHVEG